MLTELPSLKQSTIYQKKKLKKRNRKDQSTHNKIRKIQNRLRSRNEKRD